MNIGRICKKRLIGDFKTLKKDPHQYFEACPDDKDILTWYFLLKPPEFSEYCGGYYIGKIIHNENYPFKPPDFMMLTPSGRFIENEKICLSNTSYHSDQWAATWNINSLLTGFLSIMLDSSEHGVSHINRSIEERQMLAKESIEYNKKYLGNIIPKFTRFLDENGDPKVDNDNNNEEPDVSKIEKSNKKQKTKNIDNNKK
jgi:ubiquitin-protein ligase